MARPADCRDHGCSGRQPIVDEYDVLTGYVERWTVAMQNEVECHCLRQGGVDGSVHLLLREPVGGANVDAASARRHATDAVLRLGRMAHLAHGEGIERKRQATRDLGRDRDSPARETDDHSTVDASLTECQCQPSAGIRAILEENVHDWIVADHSWAGRCAATARGARSVLQRVGPGAGPGGRRCR